METRIQRSEERASFVPYGCNSNEMFVWCEHAQKANLTYHRTRSMLWNEFSRLCKYRFSFDVDYSVSPHLFYSIKSALCSRNNGFSDDKQLAFDTAVGELMEDCYQVMMNGPNIGRSVELRPILKRDAPEADDVKEVTLKVPPKEGTQLGKTESE